MPRPEVLDLRGRRMRRSYSDRDSGMRHDFIALDVAVFKMNLAVRMNGNVMLVCRQDD